jgi:hypothetical protein
LLTVYQWLKENEGHKDPKEDNQQEVVALFYLVKAKKAPFGLVETLLNLT